MNQKTVAIKEVNSSAGREFHVYVNSRKVFSNPSLHVARLVADYYVIPPGAMIERGALMH